MPRFFNLLLSVLISDETLLFVFDTLRQKLLFFIIYSVTISLQLRDPSFYSPYGFQLGILQGSSTETYFKNHIDDDLRQLYDTNLKFNLMNNFTAGIQALEKGYARGLGGGGGGRFGLKDRPYCVSERTSL